MKINLLFALLLSLACRLGEAQTTPPQPAPAAPVRRVAEFRAIDVTDGIQLYVQDVREASLRVEAPDPLRERLKTVVEGTVLKIYLDSPEGKSPSPGGAQNAIKVYVTSTGLNNLRAAKGAVVTFAHSPTRGGTLAVRLLSGASLAGEVDVTLLDIELGEGAAARVSGAASNLRVRASERSTFQGPGLQTKRCRAFAANASVVQLKVEQSLDAEAVSEAEITYSGPATLTRNARAQGGQIRRI